MGITPPPKEPSFITISHILLPFVESVVKYENVQLFFTSLHPEGISLTVKTIPVVADLPASKKATGTLSHSAKLFCSFCLCTSDRLDDWMMHDCPLRDGLTVRNQAQAWLNERTKTGREALARKHGVRWTPLFLLSYYNPVQHIILGYMHNWLDS